MFSSSLHSLRHLAWPTPFGWLLLVAADAPWSLIALPFGLYQLWLNWRLQLDAALFARLEQGTLDLATLDDGLQRLFGRNPPPRTLEQRQQATRALMRRYLAATGGYWLVVAGLLFRSA